MKTCSKCNTNKSINQFSKNRIAKDGHCSICKICSAHIRKEHYKANKLKTLENNQKYRLVNKVKLSNQKKLYKQINRAKYAANHAKRRAAKLNATPKWLTKEQLQEIRDFYEIAAAFKLYTGEEYQVDHIIPLQSDKVCGLHVPWNLQILTAKENVSKSNKLI